MKPETRIKQELRGLRKEFNQILKEKPEDYHRKLRALTDRMAVQALVYLSMQLDPNSPECDIANLGLYGFDRSWD